MNLVSIISVGVAILSLIFTTIWNITNAKRNSENDYQSIIQLIKKESIEQGETKMLFQQMNKNLERIVEDNKIMNERIYHLAERLTILEHSQQNISDIAKQIPVLDNKADKAHQRIDLIEHDLSKKEQ